MDVSTAGLPPPPAAPSAALESAQAARSFGRFVPDIVLESRPVKWGLGLLCTTAGKADSLLNMPEAQAEAQSETKDDIAKVRPVPPPAPRPAYTTPAFVFFGEKVNLGVGAQSGGSTTNIVSFPRSDPPRR